MKHIIRLFSTLVILIISIFAYAGMIKVSDDAAAAKEYKADVVAEIENSNFNPHVISGCIEQAAAVGYDLQVISCTYDERNNIQTAEIILSYSYEIPLFGIRDTKMTRGIAR